jgi:hypothetical protein
LLLLLFVDVCGTYEFVYEDDDNDEVWNKGKVLLRADIEYGGGSRPRKLLLGAIPNKDI